MYIRASSAHGLDNSLFRHYWNSHITGILIQQNSSTLLLALYSLNTQPPGLECLKLTNFWSQTYIIIAVNINFQVNLTPGKVHFKFELRILGYHLSVCWELGIRKEKSASNNRVTNSTRNRSWSSGLLIR